MWIGLIFKTSWNAAIRGRDAGHAKGTPSVSERGRMTWGITAKHTASHAGSTRAHLISMTVPQKKRPDMGRFF